MDSKERFLGDLKSTGALLEGHFILSSGRHSPGYVQCALLLQYPRLAEKYASLLAGNFPDAGISAVIGPALGGIVLAYETARAIGARALFAERSPSGAMTLRRGFNISRGEKILVAEDVITTGASALEVLQLAESCGGLPEGVCSLIDRSGGAFSPGVRTACVMELEMASWTAGECPLCREGVPPQKPGSRAEIREK